MMNTRVMQRLIWKDARSLRSLTIAVPSLIVALNMLLALLSTVTELDSEQIGISYSIWIMLPMLVAYGAPAMLIGGEEESGSLAWLRTLPAGWRSITASKYIVAIACLLLAWSVASVCLAMFLSSLNESRLASLEAQQGMPESMAALFLAMLAISLSVMLTSFTTAFWFRSPITALIVCVPMALAALWGFGFSVVFLFGEEQINRRPPLVLSDQFWRLLLLAAAELLGLFALSLFSAWRRLTWPDPTYSLSRRSDAVSEAYRPPRSAAASKLVSAMIGYRPSRRTALLWSHLHPIRWQLAGLILMALFGISLLASRSWGNEAWGAAFCGFALSMFASLTFYGDSVRQRCRFLSDRGISPTMIWLTRVVPLLMLTVIILVSMVVAMICRDWTQNGSVNLRLLNVGTILLSIGIAAFSLSQLVSQWSPRATLAFFAGPVAVTLAAFFVTAWLVFYTNSAALLLLSSAVLLFTSWKLMPRWLAGQTGPGYIAPLTAAIAIAVMLPFVVLLAARWITMPESDSAWRQRIASTKLPVVEPGQPRIAILDPAYLRQHGYQTGDSQATLRQRINAELADPDSIGAHVSFREMTTVLMGSMGNEIELDDDINKLQFDAVRVLQKWSRITREQAVAGTANFDVLFGVAENADLLSQQWLQAAIDRDGVTEAIKPLIKSLPPADLVQRSRQYSLIRSWQSYQAAHNRFAGMWSQRPNPWWLAVERTRADRSIDQLCRWMLDYWTGERSFQSSDSLQRLQQLEQDSYLEATGSVGYESSLSVRVANSTQVDRLRNELLARMAQVDTANE